VKAISVLARKRAFGPGRAGLWNGIADPYGIYRDRSASLYDANGRGLDRSQDRNRGMGLGEGMSAKLVPR
jgi:hypothetical protein